MADKDFNLRSALGYLAADLQKKVDEFGKQCLELRKKEAMAKEHIGFEKLKNKLAHKPGIDNPAAVAAKIGQEKYGKKGMAEKAVAARKTEILDKKSPPGRKKEVEELKAKGLPASEAFGIAWKQAKAKKAVKNEYCDTMKNDSDMDDSGDAMAMAEKCPVCGKDPCVCAKKAEKSPDKVPAAQRAKGSVLPSDKKVKEVSAGQKDMGKPEKLKMGKAEKPMKKAAMGGAGAPKAPSAAPAMPKTAAPKMAAPKTAAPKVPAMGAGTPQAKVAKKELAKFTPGQELKPSSPSVHLAGVGQPTAKPAKGVKTMAERIAAKVPAKPEMKAPPKVKLPGQHLFGGKAPATPPPIPADAAAKK